MGETRPTDSAEPHPTTTLKAEHLNRLQTIGESLHAYSDLEELCWATVAWVEELCGLDDCVLYVRLGNVLTQMAAIGHKSANRTIINRIGLPLGSGIVGAAALQTGTTYVRDITNDHRYVHDTYPGKSELAIPLLHHGEVHGVLDSEHPNVDGFSELNIQIMESLAMLIAPHLAALMRLRDGSPPDYSDVVAEMTKTPSISQGDLQAACATITERAGRALRVSRANIWFFDPDNPEVLECIDNYDLEANEHTSGQTLDRQSHDGYFRALQDERVIMSSGARSDDRTSEFVDDYLEVHDIYSLLHAPINQEGNLVGVLCMETVGNIRQWTSEEASFVGTLSDFATIALISHQKRVAQTALVQAQKMEALGRLAGGISHDFNNLLTVISGAVETLLLKSARPAPETKLLTLIQQAGERARKVTRNLMAFGGNQHLRLEATSAVDLLTAFESLTEGIIREDIEVEFQAPPEDLWLACDRTQIEQVLLNLVINGIDAMPQGGKLTISISATPDDQARISVTDTGKGMTDDVQQNIFEPFFTTKGEIGTGLGLSISLGIVRQHGGTIECRSTPDAGTTFDIMLPGAQPPKAVGGNASAAHKKSSSDKPRRILLVEDEVGVRNVVSEMIKALGYEPIVADNAEHALDLVTAANVDLLLTDVIMPDMRGPELYDAALEKMPELSALFISGYSEDLVRETPRGGQKVGYLGKPFTMSQLDSAIDTMLEQAR